MPANTSNVSGQNFTTLYSNQGSAAAQVAAPVANTNVSGQNFTTLYSSGSGTAPGPTDPYGNANVVSLLAVGTDGGNTVGNISATGNITAAYFIGNGSQLTNIPAGNIVGNLTAAGANTQVQFNNNGVLGADADFTFNSATNALVVTGNVQGGNLTTAGQVSAAGNITASYYFGNGSQLSGLPATYSNANVVSLLAAFGSNVISTTGNVTAGNFIGNGQYLTNIPAGNITGAYGNANVADFLANGFGSNSINTTGDIVVTQLQANGNILGNLNAIITGDVTGGNIFTAGVVSAVGDITSRGNVSANVIQPTFPGVGNSRDLTLNAWGNGNLNINAPMVTTYAFTTNGNITSIFGNLNAGSGGAGGVYSNDGFFGTAGAAQVSVIGNVTGGNIISGAGITGGFANISTFLSAGNISSPGNIFAQGNIQSGSGTFFGDGSGLDNINAANIIGAYGNANVATFLASFGSNTVSTTGNVTASYFIGNGSLLTSINGANIVGGYGNANVAANLAAFGSNPILTTGNITGANLVATANLTSTQQTVVGTANVGTTGNIVLSGRNMATDMAYSPDGATGANLYTGRVMMGTGWLGNNAVGIGSRLTTMDMINRGNTATSVRQLESEVLVNLTANVTNNSFRQQAIGGRIRVGGGSAGNVTALTNAFGVPFSMASAQNNLEIGNVSPYFLGNTTLSHATLNSGVFTLNGGSSIGNAYGYVPGVTGGGSGASTITNWIGVASTFTGANVTGNLFCFYNGNATSQGAYAISTANSARAATNYYFLRNDDDVAQVKLGSLRSYNEFQYATATSGTVNINKLNAQVQFIAPTANVTIGDFQNFVTTANDGTNNDTQSDTVTIIIQQGATPYTVTMPTGNAAIKYAANVTTVSTTANSVTMVSITAFRSSGNAAIYLTTVSPGFV
jgi:hypothetical protein